MSTMGPVLVPFLRAHPGVRVEMRTMSGAEIAALLAAHDLDAGVTYVDPPPPRNEFRSMRLYQDRFVLVSGDPDWVTTTGPVSWAELADVPLGLLTPEMDDRAVIDEALAMAGVQAAPRVEADSPSALLDLARTGWSTVVAHSWLAGWDVSADLTVRPLRSPEVRPWIGLVHRAGPLVAPVARALRAEIRTPLHPRLT
jgi:DNA-binding transcriptional LysR family regulator